MHELLSVNYSDADAAWDVTGDAVGHTSKRYVVAAFVTINVH